jgi:hypothetical protein
MMVIEEIFLLDGFGAGVFVVSAELEGSCSGLANREKWGNRPGFCNFPLLSNGNRPKMN